MSDELTVREEEVESLHKAIMNYATTGDIGDPIYLFSQWDQTSFVLGVQTRPLALLRQNVATVKEMRAQAKRHPELLFDFRICFLDGDPHPRRFWATWHQTGVDLENHLNGHYVHVYCWTPDRWGARVRYQGGGRMRNEDIHLLIPEEHHDQILSLFTKVKWKPQ